MPTNSRVFLKPFIGGLNTEASDTDDMVLNTSDELNCTILPEQMRGRRYGFNIEKDGKWINAGETITAHSLYHWNNVYGDTNFIVVQINTKLLIYRDIKPLSDQSPIWSYDLTVNQTLTVIEPVSMTSVSGSLFVVARWILPLVIKYDVDTGTFSVKENNLKFRDFSGVDDGLAVDELPSTLSMNHLYNLKNQGWDKEIYNPDNHTTKTLLPSTSSPNGLFYEEYAAMHGTGKYPANNLQWFIGKENSGKYKTEDLLNNYFGNTPAPKGHFILDYKTRSRSVASSIPVDTSAPGVSGIYLSKDIYTPNINAGNMTTAYFQWITLDNYSKENAVNITNSLNYNYVLPSSITGELNKIKIDLKENFIAPDKGFEVYYTSTINAGGNRMKMPQVWKYTPSQILAGVVGEDRYHNDSVSRYVFATSFRLRIIGISSTGAETVIHTSTRTLTGNIGTLNSFTIDLNNTTSYAKYAVRVDFPNLNYGHRWILPSYLHVGAEIQELNYDAGTDKSYEGVPSVDILKGAVTDVESFAGRVFYLCGDTVLFSQTLRDDEKYYDLCYQDADPTSEEVSDVVATDGGTIKMLSLGRGKALKSFYRGVLVFGDEEVAGILSNNINLFSAESYDVVKISKAGLTSKYSVVETDDAVFYWSNHGIYVVTIDENNNISANCISLNTIQNWYNNLSQFSRNNCVGYYDYANNRIYWFYPIRNADKLDGCLVYDITYNCFMPQQIDSGYVVRDLAGNLSGILDEAMRNITYMNGLAESVTITGDIVQNSEGDIIGYIQNKFLTDCQESSSVYEIQPTVYLRAGGNRVVAGEDKVLASDYSEPVFNRKSAGIFLISDGTHYSFGDFNDREFRDWDVSPYESYLVSRPITLGDTYFNKQTPVMQTLFKRTEVYKLIDAPTAAADLYDVTYPLIPIINTCNADSGPDHWVGNVYKTVSKILNKGVFQKTVVNFDLTNYSHNTSIIVMVKGYTHGSDRVVARTTEYAVAGNQIKTIELDTDDVILYPDYEYDSFEVVTYITATYGNPISVYGTFDIHRNDLSEEIFDGYDERVYTGAVTLTKLDHIPEYAIGADNFWEAPISTEQGYIKNGTLTTNVALSPKPSYTSTNAQSSSGPEWSATVVGIILNADEQVYTGVQGIPDYENRTVSDSAYRAVDSSNWKIALEDLVYDTAHWRLPQISVNYTFTIMIPKFRKLSTALPSGYITPSGAYIRMRWGWSVNPLSNRWDMIQNGYRPQKDFLHDDYVESRLHIRGRGKAFQVEIRNDENKDFRLTGLNIITRSPQ